MSDVTIRDLSGMADFRLAEALQNTVWGADDTADPADLMMVIAAEGGLCAGAFQGGQLVGYIFGFPTRDPMVQHSHRLAVVPQARGLHLGARLKWYQRDWCLARGITLVRWTYDPMRRINAGLNIGTLGAVAQTYYQDYYGEMQGINAGLPSDRLLAEWHLANDAVAAKAAGKTDLPAQDARWTLPLPEAFDALVANDPDRALAQRLHLRDELTTAFASGDAITGFDRNTARYRLGRLPK